MDKVTLGGDRVGSGNKMQVEMHGFQRSNHNLGYVFRSTMSAGTLVPFMCEIGLPGDTIDISLNSDIMTHPTIGPLFGSYKAQYDVYQVPVRLYNSWLHNNKLNIGRNMKEVKLPILNLTAPASTTVKDDAQINTSCILPYLGIRGIGNNISGEDKNRSFNGVPLLAYWEIYKNYYANKQEEIGAVIHGDVNAPNPIKNANIDGSAFTEYPTESELILLAETNYTVTFEFDPSIGTPTAEQISVLTSGGIWVNLTQIFGGFSYGGDRYLIGQRYSSIEITVYAWRWDGRTSNDRVTVATFPLEDIDTIREELLKTAGDEYFDIIATSTANNILPFKWLNEKNVSDKYYRTFSQEGLAVKTYQSDLFNNWLNEAWIAEVATQSAVSTLGNSFTIDELTIKKKVWELLNRIAVSGGTYNDWITATYDQKPYNRAESPVYIGGMSQELVFQEVVSNSASNSQGLQPLGTLAGKGTVSKNSRKGGKIVAKCDEHCYIIGIVSLTPRIDYSQGNRYDTNILNIDEFHKPSLDEIGFQDMITEQMAWWSTVWSTQENRWIQKSGGKQPAWLNYQTNFNRTFGNFAIGVDKEVGEMFMTLNRRYEYDAANKDIRDLTTYIDPSKYNFIFADTALDAQNFWMQIGVNIEARRKMSAKVMPNL